MFDENSLIGLEVTVAKEILLQNGYDNINVKINSKSDEFCNMTVVCAVRVCEKQVTLICGDFRVLGGEI